jgi:hypothetical protein
MRSGSGALARRITGERLCLFGGYTYALTEVIRVALRAYLQTQTICAAETCPTKWMWRNGTGLGGVLNQHRY